MRIALISDLHIDINREYPILKITAEAAEEKRADVLVIAGDISEDPGMTRSAMAQLQELCCCPVYYVPGKKIPPGLQQKIFIRLIGQMNIVCPASM